MFYKRVFIKSFFTGNPVRFKPQNMFSNRFNLVKVTTVPCEVDELVPEQTNVMFYRLIGMSIAQNSEHINMWDCNCTKGHFLEHDMTIILLSKNNLELLAVCIAHQCTDLIYTGFVVL